MDERDSDQSCSSVVETDLNEANPSQNAFNQSSLMMKSSKHMYPDLSDDSKSSFAYVCDLPNHIPEQILTEQLRQRLEKTYRFKVVNIDCYSCFGIAIVTLANKKQRDQLIFEHGSIVLDPVEKTTISFTDKIVLDSYIVLEQNKCENITVEQVTRSFTQKYGLEHSIQCEGLSNNYFPNIFRIVLTSFQDITNLVQMPMFKVKNVSATVYPLTICHFIEGMPPNMTDTKLMYAIMPLFPKTTSIYIQMNKKKDKAVIVIPMSMKKCLPIHGILVDGHNLQIKDKLSFQVQITKVPTDFDVSHILERETFRGHVKSHRQIDDRLILELDDKSVYEKCLEDGGIFVRGKSLLIAELFTITDPNKSEINSETWYDTDMLKIEPNILTFLSLPDHPIFHYQWNAQCWLEQFDHLQSVDKKSKDYDRRQHLLRVTVMLNTIGIIKKQKYIVNNEEVILKSTPMKTIAYDHRSKIELKSTRPINSLKPLYASTQVSVVNEDCLVLYEKLVSQGKNPVLLNMASATSPGGGYRKGDGAQEENIFRRSNYYQSLDLELADLNQSERYHCTGDGQLKPLDAHSRLYPMQEFGAIYTSGITVFRDTESKGYAFLSRPLYDVHAIAMAAHRNPEMIDSQSMTDRLLMSTYRKIDNIFSIAYAHKHDCLVLSAFGCGAFKNPPKQMASLFKSVILRYAGYFDTIYFAIVDDHNTGKKLNPQGNLLPYQQILRGLNVSPSIKLYPGLASGPYRILNQSGDDQIIIDDVAIGTPTMCKHGVQCPHLDDPRHMADYLHPSSCPNQATTFSCDETKDDVHMKTFIHTRHCEDGAECKNPDARHQQEFIHPDWCPQGSHCQQIKGEHMKAYRHLPICRDGVNCTQYDSKNSEHCEKYRHCKSICPDDNCCVKFLDEAHMKAMIHSFLPICPFTPYTCTTYVKYIQHRKEEDLDETTKAHCLKYSHVCLYGRQCKTRDEQHLQTTIHIPRQMCPDLDRCQKLTQEDHLECFSHPNIRDIRLLCRYAGYECRQKSDVQHFQKYRHGNNHDHLSIAPSGGFNVSIDFVRNQKDMIKTLDQYIQNQNWQNARPSNEILRWIRAAQPVHRCSKEIFESILILGHVMSRQYMFELRDPQNVALAVRQHSRVRLIFLKHNTKIAKDTAFKLIEAIVQENFNKKKETDANVYREKHISGLMNKLQHQLGEADVKTIEQWANRISQAAITLNENPKGIGYEVDVTLGTNKQVFSILGPHLGYYYGDITIIFKKELMLHPDANFSIQAATSYGPSGSAYVQRPWLTKPKDAKKSPDQFHLAKLHCSVSGYEYAAAIELMALTGLEKKSMNVSLADVLQNWKKVDSHQVFESHLPQLIPLDYIECVYIPRYIYDLMTDDVKKSTHGAFKNRRLVITEHLLDPDSSRTGKPGPSKETRENFHRHIIKEICTKIEEKMKIDHHPQGFVITANASEFDEQIIIPISIRQAFSLYCQEKKRKTDQLLTHTYIYWQAMKGDMMLTVTNQQIKSDSASLNDLRCLQCYIANRPSLKRDEYHEEYSYLHNDHPLKHQLNMEQFTLKVKSNRFHMGCNTEDFLTFCLEINHQNGSVKLSHAGSNSIYNHTTIEYKFSKSELDLSELNYVHVSAGADDVPIRNLTINFEPIADLHPQVDQTFKIDTCALLKKTLPDFPDSKSVVPFRTQYPPVQDAKPRKNNYDDDPISKNKVLKRKSSFFSRLFASFQCRAIPVVNTERKESADVKRPVSTSSKLTPCQDSIYCLHQYSEEHIAHYSHLCRFSELCRKKTTESHLMHKTHAVPQCSNDVTCTKKDDPVHRAQFRHKDLPDFLIPCRYQQQCREKSKEHRTKYFHGEQIPGFDRKHEIKHGKRSVEDNF